MLGDRDRGSQFSMWRRNKRLVFLCVTISLIGGTLDGWADGLRDFDSAGQMKFIASQAPVNTNKIYSGHWGRPHSNYSKLFVSRKGPEILYEWLALRNLKFKCEPPIKQIANDWFGFSRICRSAEDAKIKMQLFVPHQRFVDAVEGGLLAPLNQLEPPRLRPDTVEAVKVQGVPGRLFRLPDKTCSVLLKLPQATRLNLSSECANLTALFELGESLTLQRLIDKLSS